VTSGHASEENVVELACGEGSAEDRAHASACEACAGRVREAEEALALLRQADVPEPSPLYWESLRSGVKRRIAEDGRRVSAWTLLVPLAAAAALVAMFWSGGGTRPRPTAPQPALSSWSPLPAADADESLQVLEGLAAAGQDAADWDETSGLQPYLASLTDEESRALAESLRGHSVGGES
jgi:hypothetical protein